MIPKEKRIVCLYEDHCSQHVFNAFNNYGLIGGVKAFLDRYQNCTNHYTFSNVNGKIQIKTEKGQKITEEHINPLVLQACKANLH